MASSHVRAMPASMSTQRGFLSKAARRTVRRAAALTNEIDYHSFTAFGIVWTRRYFRERPEQPQKAIKPDRQQKGKRSDEQHAVLVQKHQALMNQINGLTKSLKGKSC